MPANDCSAFTPSAMLEVTGDPESVLAAYADELATITGAEPLLDEPLDVTGGRLLSTFTSEPGGVSYRASLYDTADPDTTNWLLIDSCYD